MEIIPHTNNASIYDFVMTARFGIAYKILTDNNIRTIRNIITEGKILDFGAGTARLAIPLTELGYQIKAVEINDLTCCAIEKKVDWP
jgi:2-polyprenyl-3-methyl-5-hydroxy-6-metoxy-1,4-benzoquinol methylase